MSYEQILEYVEAEPFRPLQIHMASGRSFTVRHPENIRVGKHSVNLFLYSDQKPRVYVNAVILGYSHIISLESMAPAVPQS